MGPGCGCSGRRRARRCATSEKHKSAAVETGGATAHTAPPPPLPGVPVGTVQDVIATQSAGE
eukprot:6187676-Prorocentrum_lima.AAC.1